MFFSVEKNYYFLDKANRSVSHKQHMTSNRYGLAQFTTIPIRISRGNQQFKWRKSLKSNSKDSRETTLAKDMLRKKLSNLRGKGIK